MTIKILILIIILATNFRICQTKKYDGYVLYSVTPRSNWDLNFLRSLTRHKYTDIVFWKLPIKLNEEVQFIVSPMDVALFMEKVQHNGINVKVVNRNIQTLFDEQKTRRYINLRTTSFAFDYYHTLWDIELWLLDLANKYKDVVEVETIGKTVDGRGIIAVAINWKSYPAGNVIVEAGIHGHEWFSIAFVTYLIDQLVHANETTDIKLKQVSRKYNWYLIPVANPDGFVHTHLADRLWRKNRAIYLNKTVGVDLNRNFDYSFGKHLTSIDPENEFYCGPQAFSEPETRAIRDYIFQYSKSLQYYFAFHSYGQKILIPYGDRVDHVEDYMEIENYAKHAIVRMYHRTGTKYTVGTTYAQLGTRISGDSVSWVKRRHRTKFAYTFILPDNGTYGYALPSRLLLPYCEETLDGLTELMTSPLRHITSSLFDMAPYIRGNLLLVLICVFVVIK